MFPVSEEFRAAVRGSHTITLRAEVWRGGQKLATLDVLSGEVTDDARRAIRRSVTCDLAAQRELVTIDEVMNTYADVAAGHASYAVLAASAATYAQLVQVVGTTSSSSPDPLVPGTAAADALNPYGNELRLWRGVIVQREIPDTYASVAGRFATYAALSAAHTTYGEVAQSETLTTVDEQVPLGVFVITEFDATDDGGAIKLTVRGEDRARRISRNRWTDPYQVTAGTPAVDAITGLLQDRWDDVEIVTSTTSTATVGAAVFGQEADNDPWADARSIAKAAGLDLFFDAEGRAVIADVPSVEDTSADVTFAEGTDGVLLSLKRSANAATTYNGVIATGEGTSTEEPVRGEAWDEEPTSPTYRYGEYGQVPRFYSSPLITTAEQAASAAAAILRQQTGLTEGIEWTFITDPSVQAGDVALVTGQAIRVNRFMILDMVRIPLAVDGSMGAIGRTVAEEAA